MEISDHRVSTVAQFVGCALLAAALSACASQEADLDLTASEVMPVYHCMLDAQVSWLRLFEYFEPNEGQNSSLELGYRLRVSVEGANSEILKDLSYGWETSVDGADRYSARSPHFADKPVAVECVGRLYSELHLGGGTDCAAEKLAAFDDEKACVESYLMSVSNDEQAAFPQWIEDIEVAKVMPGGTSWVSCVPSFRVLYETGEVPNPPYVRSDDLPVGSSLPLELRSGAVEFTIGGVEQDDGSYIVEEGALKVELLAAELDCDTKFDNKTHCFQNMYNWNEGFRVERDDYDVVFARERVPFSALVRSHRFDLCSESGCGVVWPKEHPALPSTQYMFGHTLAAKTKEPDLAEFGRSSAVAFEGEIDLSHPDYKSSTTSEYKPLCVPLFD